MSEILQEYQFTALKYDKEDGSVTLSLDEIELAENAKDEIQARLKLGKSILDHAFDYYDVGGKTINKFAPISI